jgi:hypothetical protein
MEQQLEGMVALLDRYQVSPTFPITAAALARHKSLVARLARMGVELAAHGYVHVDHSLRTFEMQQDWFERARQVFAEQGISCAGFRAPYARRSADTLRAVYASGWKYDSSDALAWQGPRTTHSYEHALEFYGAHPASRSAALPHIVEGLVVVPFALPDDEALVERLSYSAVEMAEVWTGMLRETHARGELLVLNLHPERFELCRTALEELLKQARLLSGDVWITSLDRIASWWIARTNATVTVTEQADDWLLVQADGPPGALVLARGVEWGSPFIPLQNGYARAQGEMARMRSAKRPMIGVSPNSAPHLGSFLREQGYIIERSADAARYSFYLDIPHLVAEDERALLDKIERGRFPLARLGRWFDGAQSALCISGDIDAFTLYDYAARLLGK